MPAFDISSVGFYVLDILGRPVTAIPPGGRAFFIDEIAMTVAGTAGATAMACAILGLRTRAVGSVGDDEMGDIMLNALGRKGIDTSLVECIAGVQTSATILPVRPNGERPALHVPGSAAHFRVAPDHEDAALDARFVHFGGTGLLKAFDGEPTLHLIRKAKDLGRTTTFDLIQANPETIALVEPLLPFIDYFIPSIDEASEMAGRSDPDDVATLLPRPGRRDLCADHGGRGLPRRVKGRHPRAPSGSRHHRIGHDRMRGFLHSRASSLACITAGTSNGAGALQPPSRRSSRPASGPTPISGPSTRHSMP